MVPSHTGRPDEHDRPSGSNGPGGPKKAEDTGQAFGSNGRRPAQRSRLRRLGTAAFVLGIVVAVVVGAVPGAGAVTAPTATEGAGSVPPAPDDESTVKVAFIADAGMNDDSREVLRLIADEEADVVVYSGDFDYHDDPEGWVDMLDEELGPNVPVLAAMGNHDVEHWDDYRRVISERLDRSDAVRCTGDLGWRSTCTVGDLTVVQSGVGICDYDDPPKAPYLPDRCADNDVADDEAYVAGQLANTTTTWRVCSWHLVNERYQVGDKKSLVPASMYDTCRESGAIVATGHNHAYARTHPMADFSTGAVADESPPYTVGDGSSFAIVSAAAGHSFYDTTDRVDAPYWGATHTDGAFGAFFATFRPDGTGEAYFKTVDGEVVDGPFEIRRPTASDPEPTPEPEPAPDHTIVLHAGDNPDVVDVSFLVDGDATYGDEAEPGTDTIEPGAEGTWVTSVELDPDALDSYVVTGPVIDYDVPDGYTVDVSWNGTTTTFAELVGEGPTDGGSDPVADTSEEHAIQLHASPDNPDVVDVSFVVDGDASYGDESESETDTIESVDAGTRVTSVEMDPDALDSYVVTGDVVDFSLPDGYDVAVTWDGAQTTFEELVGSGASDGALPNTLVVDGRGTDSVTTYAFTVSGEVERDAEASRLTAEATPWDQIADLDQDDTVIGVVGDGVDVYRFSGEVVSQTVDGDANVTVETG